MTLYLSKLVLSMRSREARSDLSDRYELHRTLLAAFPAQLPEDERVLFRVEEQTGTSTVPVLVQSHYEPEWITAERLNIRGYLLCPPAVRRVEPNFEDGTALQFRLQANPTVKRDGKRHAIYPEDELRQWLARKGDQHGFDISPDHLRVVKLGNKYGKNRRQTWHAVQYDGLLSIKDTAEFDAALRNGIGSAKGFGFGLLSVPYPAA